jgi:hypothetical protein
MTTGKQFIICLALGLLSFVTLKAQTKFEIPKNVELNSNDDYSKYESTIIDAAKWLEETDLDEEREKRQDVNAFVVDWITGSPTVKVIVNSQLVKLYSKNEQLLAVYFASYSRNCLENKATSTKTSATKAALISIMNVYKKGIYITKNKEMDELIKLTNDNKLDDYIKDNF